MKKELEEFKRREKELGEVITEKEAEKNLEEATKRIEEKRDQIDEEEKEKIDIQEKQLIVRNEKRHLKVIYIKFVII